MSETFRIDGFNIKVNKLRYTEGLSQQRFADKLDVDRVMVAYWESGKSFPSYKTLKKIAETFNVSVDWLMGFSDEMYRKDLHKTS